MSFKVSKRRSSVNALQGADIIEITVISATGLTAKNNATSDPYCKCVLGKEKWKTKVVKKNLYPVWNDCRTIIMAGAQKQTLKLSIWHKETLWKDAFMGECEVSLSTYAKPGQTTDTWFNLNPRNRSKKDNVSGKIRVSIMMQGDNKTDSSSSSSPSPALNCSPSSSSSKTGKSQEAPSASPTPQQRQPQVVPSVSVTVASDDSKEDKGKEKTKESTNEEEEEEEEKVKEKASNKANEERTTSQSTLARMIQEIQKVYNNPASCVKKLKWDEKGNVLAFLLVTDDSRMVSLSVFVGEEYPIQRPVLMMEGTVGAIDESKVENLIQKTNEYASKRANTLADIMSFLSTHFDRMLNKGKMKQALKTGQSVNLKATLNASLAISQALGESWRVTSMNGDDEDCDYYSDEDYFDEEVYDWDDIPPEETLIEKHVKQVQIVFGRDSCTLWRELNTVRLFLDAHFLDAEACEAMGVDIEEPITIALQFGPGYLENDKIPGVEVKQSQNKRFGLEFQLTEIARAFLKNNWPSRRMGLSLQAASDTVERSRMVARTQNIKELLQQGFDQLAAATALEMASNQLDVATNLLAVEGGSVDSTQIIDSEEAKHNFIAWMMTYMLSRLRNCTSYCIVCDTELFGGGIKPVVCDQESCVWRYEELGLGAKITNDVSLDANVVDMLISMCVAASYSNRSDLIFAPFPRDFINASGGKDLPRLKRVLGLMPPVSEIAQYTEEERALRKYLEDIDSDLYRLLRWILTTNRAYIKTLDAEKHITQMNTPHQYVLLSSPPEKRAKFVNYRRQYGSFFAFHGSSLENWHAIMRTGLKNLSNTKLMTTGAVYGAGIYLSPHANTSKDYSRAGKGWDKSVFGDGNINCIAICEVINHPCLKGQPNPHYVVPDEDLVITRFFCIYTNTTIPAKVDLGSLRDYLYSLQGYVPQQDGKGSSSG
ncbi:Poly [ADP-ribose] polymerase 6 [Balamuthia mandrillaris]